MKRIWNFMGTLPFVGVCGVVSILFTALAAFSGDQFSIGILAGWALVGFIFGIINLRRWISSNEGWDRAINGWSEQEDLTMDLTCLLGESLSHLSTWDRETADDIAERTNTIIRLRFQNFRERNHP